MDSRTVFFGPYNLPSAKRFEADYDMQKKVLARGDMCEIRQCIDRRSKEIRTVKVYRKGDISAGILTLVK